MGQIRFAFDFQEHIKHDMYIPCDDGDTGQILSRHRKKQNRHDRNHACCKNVILLSDAYTPLRL